MIQVLPWLLWEAAAGVMYKWHWHRATQSANLCTDLSLNTQMFVESPTAAPAICGVKDCPNSTLKWALKIQRWKGLTLIRVEEGISEIYIG